MFFSFILPEKFYFWHFRTFFLPVITRLWLAVAEFKLVRKKQMHTGGSCSIWTNTTEQKSFESADLELSVQNSTGINLRCRFDNTLDEGQFRFKHIRIKRDPSVMLCVDCTRCAHVSHTVHRPLSDASKPRRIQSFNAHDVLGQSGEIYRSYSTQKRRFICRRIWSRIHCRSRRKTDLFLDPRLTDDNDDVLASLCIEMR